MVIITKYLGPTGTLGARISAVCDSGNLIIPYDYGLSPLDAHAKACRKLAHKLRWYGAYCPGSTAEGYVWIKYNFNHVIVCRENDQIPLGE